MYSSNFAYRNYMTTHGKDIIAKNRQIFLIESGFSPSNNEQVSTNVPFLYKNSRQITIPAGYTASDLKTGYIIRENNSQFVDDFKIIRSRKI